MEDFIVDFLNAQLIPNFGGDNSRYQLMVTAAQTLADQFSEEPQLLIRAVLAGLDQEVDLNDPAIQIAYKAAIDQWPTMGGVYSDPPIGLLRALLWEGCRLCSHQHASAIILFTSTDQLAFSRLGRESAGIKHFLSEIVSNAFTSTAEPIYEVEGETKTAITTQGYINPTIEKIQLDSLWWSQSLYSPSLQCSYRDMPPHLAAIVMSVDLLKLAEPLPTPVSVGHLLAETVNRLPNAGFEASRPFAEWLQLLRQDQARLATLTFTPPPGTGRLSLRDTLVLTLQQPKIDPTLRQRAGGTDTVKFSLPQLAHALFRQEQAVRLAEQPI